MSPVGHLNIFVAMPKLLAITCFCNEYQSLVKDNRMRRKNDKGMYIEVGNEVSTTFRVSPSSLRACKPEPFLVRGFYRDGFTPTPVLSLDWCLNL
jgi:hypothetical protein